MRAFMKGNGYSFIIIARFRRYIPGDSALLIEFNRVGNTEWITTTIGI